MRLLVIAPPSRAPRSLTPPIPSPVNPSRRRVAGAIPRDESSRPDSRDTLTLVAHIADGATKEVRALGGGYVVFQNGAWLEFYDMSDPFEPVPRARILLAGAALGHDASSARCSTWPCARPRACSIVDVSNPAAPVVVGQREGNDMLSVAVGNGYAYCGRRHARASSS